MNSYPHLDSPTSSLSKLKADVAYATVYLQCFILLITSYNSTLIVVFLDYLVLFLGLTNVKQLGYIVIVILNFCWLGSIVHKIQKHFQNVMLVGMASEISKNYTYKCVDRSRHNGIKGAKAKCAH